MIGCINHIEQPIDTPGKTKIGFLSPFSGPNYPYLIHLHRGADIVLSSHDNIQGIYENCDPSGFYGSQAPQRLINHNGVVAILGPADPLAILKVQKTADKEKVLHFSCFSNPVLANHKSAFSFSNVPADRKQIELVSLFFDEYLRSKRVAIIFQAGSYHEVMARHLTRRLINKDIRINIHPVSDHWNEIGLKRPEALLLLLHPERTLPIIKMVRTKMPDLTILCGQGSLSEHDLEHADRNKVYNVQFPMQRNRRYYRTFRREFQQFHAKLNATHPTLFHEEPNIYEAYAYEAASILAEAIREVGADPELIRRYLTSTTFSSLTGPLKFNQQGEVNRNFQIVALNGAHLNTVPGFGPSFISMDH